MPEKHPEKNTSAFFFDFDGVILDTLAVKTNAYKDIFRIYGPDIVARVVDYHQQHAGISRVEKIRFANEHILDLPYSKSRVSAQIEQYSELVFDKVISAAWIPGAREFLEQHCRHNLIFVVSGTPETELKEIVRRRNMEHFFRGVFGAPTKKADHIRSLVGHYNLAIENCFFIGDALTDYYAARETGMPFIGIRGEIDLPEDAVVLPDCNGLQESMARLGNKAITRP